VIRAFGAWGNRNGEKGDEDPVVDEGRHPGVKDARTREDKDDGDRSQAEAERACDVSAGVKTGRDVGRTPQEERGVNLVRWAGGAIPEIRYEGRMSQKDIGTCFEIKVDGKTRSYRDQKETAIEAGQYLKQLQPKVEVSVRDLRDNSVTMIDGEKIIALDLGAGGKH
jgi:hypothetical protein